MLRPTPGYSYDASEGPFYGQRKWSSCDHLHGRPSGRHRTREGSSQPATDWLLSKIWEELLSLTFRFRLGAVVIQWVPSGTHVPRNASVHDYAQAHLDSTRLNRARAPALLTAVLARVLKSCNESWKGHATVTVRDRLARAEPTNLYLGATLCCKDEAFITQLRTGCCRLIGLLRYHLGITDNRACRWCGRQEESSEHVLIECQAPCICESRSRLRLPRSPLHGLNVQGLTAVVAFFRSLLGDGTQDKWSSLLCCIFRFRLMYFLRLF